MAKGKKKQTKGTNSYQNLMGSPMNVANHPVNNMPAPMGGDFNGMLPGLSPQMMGY